MFIHSSLTPTRDLLRATSDILSIRILRGIPSMIENKFIGVRIYNTFFHRYPFQISILTMKARESIWYKMKIYPMAVRGSIWYKMKNYPMAVRESTCYKMKNYPMAARENTWNKIKIYLMAVRESTWYKMEIYPMTVPESTWYKIKFIQWQSRGIFILKIKRVAMRSAALISRYNTY